MPSFNDLIKWGKLINEVQEILQRHWPEIENIISSSKIKILVS